MGRRAGKWGRVNGLWPQLNLHLPRTTRHRNTVGVGNPGPAGSGRHEKENTNEPQEVSKFTESAPIAWASGAKSHICSVTNRFCPQASSSHTCARRQMRFRLISLAGIPSCLAIWVTYSGSALRLQTKSLPRGALCHSGLGLTGRQQSKARQASRDRVGRHSSFLGAGLCSAPLLPACVSSPAAARSPEVVGEEGEQDPMGE